ncbi:MAG TPA: UPF0182 family protein [Frankiaceae bacterium]|nr:UPF0182 family protein [Frankiaceae bacterium]
MAVRNPLRRRRPRFLVPIVLTIIVLIILGAIFVNSYTDLLFFRSVHFSSVFTKVLGTRLVLFLIFGLIMAIAVATTIVIAYRLRPSIRPMSLEQQNLERYRLVLEPFHTWLLIVIAGLAGIFAGLSASGRWRTYLLWVNGQKFGVKDPQFHRDISYFMFTYPFQRFLLGFAFTVVVVCLVIAALTHYFFGGVRLQTQDRVEKVIPAAKVHLSVMLGLFVLLKAVAYYLDRFGLAFSPRGKVTGASYTDVHAVLPAKTILLFISVLCAVLFIYNIRQRGWILPALSFGILVISSLVIGGLYPTLIQYFSVRPNESVKERPYIARNITATRAAYGIGTNKVSISTYPASQNVTAAQIGADKGTIPNTRLLDPVVLSKTFEQLQQIRSYYGFPPNLDIDRYSVDGKTQDYIVSVRELDQTGLSSNQRNWINLHLNYTHGKGFVAAPANTVDDTGRPVFAEKDLPVTGPLDITQDDIYFGEQSPKYSIVDTKQAEIDGPSGSNTASGNDQKTNHYSGTGGVSVGGTFNRLVFALKFGDKNLLLSSAITNKSRILYVRNPRTRVQKVAPWLTLDGDPYPAVINGRIEWILDGYTTSSGYPYSERTRLGDVTTDANTGGNRAAQANNEINYIRNSVKATVDAYTGEVTLYAFDPSDPVLKTWMKAFPGTVKTTIPEDLRVHFRYPEDLFKVQRDLIGQYHVTDPVGFYTQEDFWSVPDEPGNAGTQQPPFYQFAQLPGQSQADFNLTSPMNAQRAPKLSAFMYVSSDPENYGQIKVLELPQGVTINGPVQAKATIESNSVVSSALSLLRQSGSQTISGNLLTLPVADGLIYVEPYYVQATSDQGYPTLQDIAVAYGDRIGFARTLQGALTNLFGQGAGNSTTQTGNGSGPTPSPTPSGSGSNTNGASPAVQALAAQAASLFQKAQQAFGSGDFTAYGKYETQLQQTLDKLVAAGKVTASPTPSPSGKASASPSSSASPSASATVSPSPTP